MAFKDTLKKEFANESKVNELRYKASKLTFVLTSLLFFLSLYFYGAGLFLNIISEIVSILYILLLVSLFVFLYFLATTIFKAKINGIYTYILIAVLFVLLVIFILPVVVNGGVFSFFK